MQDHFQTLNLPREAALNPDTVKARFQELSRDLHPDAGNNDDKAFAALNAAQSCLSRASTRLKHLIELETGEAPPSRNTMSPGLMDLFSPVADILSKADHYIARKSRTTTALAKAMLSKDAPELIQQLMLTGGEISAYRKNLDEQLTQAKVSSDLAPLAHEFSFIEKWQSQVQERMGNML